MADPNSKGRELQQTYALTVKVHDLMGEAPQDLEVPVQIRLSRADNGSTAPLFGPQGLIAGTLSSKDRPYTMKSPPMIEEGTVTFQLIPNAYYFVPTYYTASVGGRNYRFVMPAADSDLITLLDGEVIPAGGADAITGLPVGSSALDSLRWNAAMNAWQAVSSTSVIYYAITRGNGFSDLSSAIRSILTSGDAQVYSSTLGLYVTANQALDVFETSDYAGSFDVLWPVGMSAPYLWVAVPTAIGLATQYTGYGEPDGGGTETSAAFLHPNFSLTVEGVPYDCGVVQLPRSDRAAFKVIWDYEAPVIASPSIVEISR